jgi:hypothetical protein
MSIIPEVSKAINEVISKADKLAIETGFVKRTSKITGSVFVKTLVFGWMSNPDSSLEELAQVAATMVVKVSPQGLEQRFNQEACEFLNKVLTSSVENVISSDAEVIPILKKFNGVYIDDSTVIVLPDELKIFWEGCGGSSPKNTSAAVKMQVRFNFKDGSLSEIILQNGRKNDQGSILQEEPLPEGSLRLSDLGYFSVKVFSRLAKEDKYWLNRLQSQTAVFNELNERNDVVELLEKQCSNQVDIPIKLGAEYQLSCRLIAIRVKEEVANNRRRIMHKEARDKGRTVLPIRLRMADWNIFITNAPEELLSLKEALVLIKVRWQIEKLFNLWKTYGKIDKSRSLKPFRILCELYAKMLVMIIQHWIVLTSSWSLPDRSLIKAFQTIKKYALVLAISLNSFTQLCRAIGHIGQCLLSGCKINKRKKKPATFQLLISLSEV